MNASSSTEMTIADGRIRSWLPDDKKSLIDCQWLSMTTRLRPPLRHRFEETSQTTALSTETISRSTWALMPPMYSDNFGLLGF